MTPITLALIGAALVFLAGVAAASGDARRWWRIGAAWAVCAGIVGVWWMLEPAGQLTDTIYAEAEQAGVPVATVVVYETAGPRPERMARRVALKQPVPIGGAALGTAAALAFLAGLAGALRRSTPGVERFVAFLPVLGGLVAVLALATAGGSAAGAAAVREMLAGVNLAAGGNAVSFTVPEGQWTLTVPHLMPLIGVTVLALVAAGAELVGVEFTAARPLVAVGAAIVAGAVVWQMLAVGGLPWRATEGALWAAGLLAAGAWLERATPARGGALAGCAVTLALLASSV